MATQPAGYRNYSADGTYWTVRKIGSTYWVTRIDNSDGTYRWSETWGGYRTAGAAGGAAAQLAYRQAVADTTQRLRTVLHSALDDVGLGVPTPPAPPVSPDHSPVALGGAYDGDEED